MPMLFLMADVVYTSAFYFVCLQTKGKCEMKKHSIFEGVATAIVTPMDDKGAVDYAAFERMINWQICRLA